MRFREFFPAGSVRICLSGERAGEGKAGQPARLYEKTPFEPEVPDDPHDFVICPGSGHRQYEFHILTKTGFFSLLFLSNVQIFSPKPVFSVKTRNSRRCLGFRVFGALKTAGTPKLRAFRVPPASAGIRFFPRSSTSRANLEISLSGNRHVGSTPTRSATDPHETWVSCGFCNFRHHPFLP